MTKIKTYLIPFLLIASLAFCAAEQPTNKSVQGIIDWSLTGGFIESGSGEPTASATEGNLYVDVSDPENPELWRYTSDAWAKIAGGGGFTGDTIDIPYTTATPTVSTDAITLWADDNLKVLRAYDGRGAWHNLWTPPDLSMISLLHFDNNLTDSTGFQAWSGLAYSFDSSIKKFGSHGLLISGSGGFVASPTTRFDDPGTSEFTVDFWVRFAFYSQNMYLCGNSKPTASEGWHISMTNAEPAYFQVKGVSGTWGQDMISTGTISTGQWYHVELDCSATTCYFFIDGNLVDTCSRGDIVTSTNPFKIADNTSIYPDATNFVGYIDEFRYTTSVKHTESFTPPTAPYE